MAVKCNLKVIMVQKKIKQIDLAKEVCVSKTTINSICNDKSLPTLELALKIADVLDLTVHDIWRLEKS